MSTSSYFTAHNSPSQQSFTDNLRPWEIESTLIYMQQAGMEERTSVSQSGPAPDHHEYIERVLKERPLKIACDAVIRMCEAGPSDIDLDQRRRWLFLLETIIPLWNRRNKGCFETNPLCSVVKRAIAALQPDV